MAELSARDKAQAINSWYGLSLPVDTIAADIESGKLRVFVDDETNTGWGPAGQVTVDTRDIETANKYLDTGIFPDAMRMAQEWGGSQDPRVTRVIAMAHITGQQPTSDVLQKYGVPADLVQPIQSAYQNYAQNFSAHSAKSGADFGPFGFGGATDKFMTAASKNPALGVAAVYSAGLLDTALGAGAGTVTPAAETYAAGGGELTQEAINAGNAITNSGLTTTAGANTLTNAGGAGTGTVNTAGAGTTGTASAALQKLGISKDIADKAQSAIDAGRDIQTVFNAVKTATGIDIPGSLMSAFTGAAQAFPYTQLDPGNSKARDYMTNAGWQNLNPQDTAAQAMNAAGFKSGGIGAMPTTLMDTYKQFLQNPLDLAKSPQYQAWDKLQNEQWSADRSARGLGRSDTMTVGLSDRRAGQLFGMIPQFGSMYQGGAQTEADRWNTENQANLVAGGLANTFYNTAQNQNTNAAVTGLNQMGADVGMADRYSGIAGQTLKPINTPQYITTPDGRTIQINLGGK